MVRQRFHLPGLLAIASLAVGACLPRGEPPAGHQILADPTASLLQLIPSGSDGMRHVLFFRPSQRQDPDLVDLWTLTLDPNDQPSPERLLVSNIASGLQLSYRPSAGSSGFPVDSHGRVYVFTDEGDDLFRIDPATGDRLDVGPDQFAVLSPSGQRVLTRGQSGSYILYEADDHTVTVDGSQGQFVGETLFYTSRDCYLMRLVPGGAPEQVASSISNYFLLRGTLLYVQHLGLAMCGAMDFIAPSSGPQALLDTVTLQETPLPAGVQLGPGNISSDGRWMTASRFDQMTFRSQQVIIDLTTGSTEDLDPGLGYGVWRPGHDELWLAATDDSQPGLAGASLNIKMPGQPPVTIPGVYPSGFNEDGRYWFSRGTPPDQLLASDLVGDADNPTGPRYHAVPEGSGLGLAQTLPDGRLLVESYTSVDTFRSDDYLIVDPRNGAMNTVGLRGYLSALGKDRLVGIFSYLFERGDLTAVDFATGRRTILAAEDANAAIVEGNTIDSDQLPSGARVVYQFRARYTSPWSGLWIATVP